MSGDSEVGVPNRIGDAADWSHVQPLRDHVPSWANAQNAVGSASGEMTLTMVFSRSATQQAALDKLLADQQNPASPDYHHWLTPEEFGKRFGLSDADMRAVTDLLKAQGLRVNFVAPGRDFVGFGGTAAAVGKAFGTEIRNYLVNGAQRIAPASEPMIPSALGPVVKAIHGLYTIEDRPQHMMTGPQTAGPELTLSNGAHILAPKDFQIIYDAAASATGAEQTIGIVGRSRTDFTDFYSLENLAYSPFQVPTEVVPTAFGGVDPGPAYTAPPPQGTSLGDQSEATLDVTRAGTVAPGANLLLVVATAASGGIEADAQYLVQTSPLPTQIMSISFGACESEAGPSGVTFWDSLFEQAAAEGISVFVSSGDSGASGCEQDFSLPAANPPAISPNYICSSSYATCVGGTEFNDTANPSLYWKTTNGSNLDSALSYIPEGGWNEPKNGNNQLQIAGSGGGVSTYIATPAWQKGTGVPAARAGRYTPDVSFSSSCHNAYFGCMASAGGSCLTNSQGQFSFLGFCGTSAAAPSMAGVAALLDQSRNDPQGNLNPEIYALARSLPATFHDATPTTSGVTACSISTPSMCNNSTPGPGGLTSGQAGYPLTAGYDLVTGVGSLDIAKFVSNFGTALPAPSVTVTPSATEVTTVESFTIKVTVAGTQGQPTPTGTIRITGVEPFDPPVATLTSGVATIVFAPGSIPGSIDTDVFTAEYIPDSASEPIYSPATGKCQVSITLISPTVAASISPNSITTAQRTAITVTVSGPGGAPVPTGKIAIETASSPTYSSVASLSNGTVTISVPAGVLPPGIDWIDVTYQTDQNAGKTYFNSLGEASVTVTQAPKTTPVMTTSLSASNVTLADAFTVTATLKPATGAEPPTGSVALSGIAHPITGDLLKGSATINVPPDWLPLGPNTLTITYSGDNNSNPVTASAPITVSKVVPTFTITSPSTISADQDLNVYIALDRAGMFPWPTGSVTLSGGNYTSPAATLGLGNAQSYIPGNSLPVGVDTITASYSGDSIYAASTGVASVNVTPIPPSIVVTGNGITISAPGATTGNTSTITVTPAGGFTGTVNLSAKLTASPAGAKDVPTVSFGSTSPVNITGASAVTATVTVSTTAPSQSALVLPTRRGGGWYAAGETALACLIFFGIPAHRKRKWRAWVGMALLLAALSSAVVACGGGGGSSSSSPPPHSDPGTTPGTYTVTLTAKSGALTAESTIAVNVQ